MADANHTPPTILAVDDNHVNRRIFGSLLQRLGLACDTANDGKEALEAVKAHPGQYKHILMDISMPVVDGFESSRLIRAFEQENGLDRCSIIGVHPGEITASQMEECGIDGTLLKPVRVETLRKALEEVGLPVSESA